MFSGTLPGDWGDESDPDTGVAVLRSTNFRDDGSIDYGDLAFRSIAAARLEKRWIHRGTILIEKAGGSSTRPAGRVVYCDRDFDGTASNFVEIVRVAQQYVPQYVFYLLYWNYYAGRVHQYPQQTTGIINFKLSEYSDEEVLVPAKTAEQSKIAEVLSTVDRVIKQTETLIAKQQRIETGLMQDLHTRGIDEHGNLRSEQTHEFKDSRLGRIPVEWHVKALDEIVDESITYGIVQAGAHVDGGVPYIRTGDMRGDEINVEKLLRTAPQVAKSYKRSAVWVGDIVFALRATVGKVWPVTVELDGANLTQGTAKISPRKSIDSDFLLWAMRSSQVQNAIRLEQKGTTFMEITLGDLRTIRLALPKKKDEQSLIAEKLNRHDRLRRYHAKQRDKLVSLKRGLMQDLLTGTRRVTALLEEREGVTT